MFFLRMIFRSFSRQFKRRLLIAVTVCLSATVSVALLGVVFDVGDKLNAELSTYGSNITVQPKADAVVSDLYNTGGSSGSSSDSDPTAFLKESDAPKIKTIFWAFNITNFAPELNIHVDAGCSDGSASADSCKATNVPIVGTWFAKTLHMDSGESTVAGMNGMRSWWKLDGSWPKDDTEQGLIGTTLASQLGVKIGDTVTLGKTISTGERNHRHLRCGRFRQQRHVHSVHRGADAGESARFDRQDRSQGADYA